MTISTTNVRIQYAGNDVTTAFAVPFLFFVNSHLVVKSTDEDGNDTTLVQGVDYTVSGAGSPSGGTVTTTTAPVTDSVLTIYRDVPYTQLVDYIQNDSFPAQTHETALDKLTMLCQQIKDLLARALVYPITEPTTTTSELPTATDRAEKVLAFDADGNPEVIDLLDIPITVSDTLFTVGSPSGTATVKSVTVTIPAATIPMLARAWIVKGDVTSATLTRAVVLPSGNYNPNMEALSNPTSLSFTLTHTGAQTSWKLCIEIGGVVILTSAITVGV